MFRYRYLSPSKKKTLFYIMCNGETLAELYSEKQATEWCIAYRRSGEFPGAYVERVK